MRIFLVAWLSGSGKGVVSNLIKEYYIYKLESCAITGFTKYLKNFAKELSDWDGSESTKPRKYLQELGDKVRSIDSKYLINNMIQDINIYKEYVDNLVISDVRLPEEIDDLKLNCDNVYAIYVENQFSASKLSVDEQSHITETALENYDDFDINIINDGSIDDLKEKVFKFLDGVK